jgi:carbamoyl-phosphate synthase large subunit
MKNLLFTNSGQNTINAIKSLKGYNIFTADMVETAGLFMGKRRYLVPKAEDPAFVPIVMKICKHEKIDVIFPTHSKDIFVLAEFTERFREIGLNMCLSTQETYLMTEDKKMCSYVLKEAGIPTPKIYNKPKFPCMLKPINSSGSKKTYKIEDEEDLEYNQSTGSFMSEFIKGQEYVVDGVSDLKGKVIACIPRIRQEAKGGICIKAQTIKDEKLEEAAIKVAELFKMVGGWNIQFIRRAELGGDKDYVIDVNNRLPSGGTPLAVASGLNIPEIMVKLALGEKVKKPKLKYGLKMFRYYEATIINKKYEIC